MLANIRPIMDFSRSNWQ